MWVSWINMKIIIIKYDPRASRDTTNLSWRRPAQNFQPNKTSEFPNKRNNFPSSTITCDYCKRKGHTMSDCYRNPQNQTKPTGVISTPDNNTTSVFAAERSEAAHILVPRALLTRGATRGSGQIQNRIP